VEKDAWQQKETKKLLKTFVRTKASHTPEEGRG